MRPHFDLPLRRHKGSDDRRTEAGRSRGDLVQHYALRGREVYARMLFPLIEAGPEPVYHSWSSRATAVNFPMSGTVTWDQFQPALSGAGLAVELPRGTAPHDTLSALARVIVRHHQRLYVSTWDGYAGERDRTSGLRQALESQDPPWPVEIIGGSRTLDVSVAWLPTRNDEAGFHVPTAVMPSDGSFLLATAVYQDSYYFSGTSQMYSSLLEVGLELFEIDPLSPLPSRGD